MDIEGFDGYEEGLRWVVEALDGYGGLSSPTPDPPYPSHTFHTTLGPPDLFQDPLHTHPNPFTTI